MKKTFAVLVVLAIVFSVGFVFAEEKENKDSWKFFGEASVGMHNKYVDDDTGELWYDKSISTQSAMIGFEKAGTGFYFQADNFVPFEKQESKETDIYLGFYTEAWGMKFDGGLGHYWTREKGEADWHSLYGSVDFPSLGWGIVPFTKAEYRLATRKEWVEDENGNENPVSLNGFFYQVGLKREFKLTEKVSIVAKLTSGGNTGALGYETSNLAYIGGKVEGVIDVGNNFKLKPTVYYQKNLGGEGSVAAEANEKIFLGLALSWSW